MRWLLHLYPRAWRQRYGEEYLALLAEMSSSPLTVIDCLRAALDAHARPQFAAGDAAGRDSATYVPDNLLLAAAVAPVASPALEATGGTGLTRPAVSSGAVQLLIPVLRARGTPSTRTSTERMLMLLLVRLAEHWQAPSGSKEDAMTTFRDRVRDHHVGQRLEEVVQGTGLAGQPLSLPSMPFTLSSDAVISAMISGPPRHILRRRQIEDGVERLLHEARTRWLALAQRYARDPARFVRAWRGWVASADAESLNRLIEAHNTWYAVEARLPVDSRTGAYITPDGGDYHYAPVTPAWLLARFPADLASAVAANTPRDG